MGRRGPERDKEGTMEKKRSSLKASPKSSRKSAAKSGSRAVAAGHGAAGGTFTIGEVASEVKVVAGWLAMLRRSVGSVRPQDTVVGTAGRVLGGLPWPGVAERHCFPVPGPGPITAGELAGILHTLESELGVVNKRLGRFPRGMRPPTRPGVTPSR
jgi:hypothetical protein